MIKAAASSDTKSELGQFFTMESPFNGAAWNRWALKAEDNIVEPFAGAGNLPALTGLPMAMYDIEPQGKGVQQLDTLSSFPQGYATVITNPPYLARVSATRTNTPYPETTYADLYQHCLAVCLENVDSVAAIVPASFIQAAQRGMFEGRLIAIDERTHDMFQDTTVPVVVAYFLAANPLSKPMLYRNGNKIRPLLNDMKPTTRTIKFNDPQGTVGLYATDGGVSKMRFVDGDSIDSKSIKVSSRTITRISGLEDVSIEDLNAALAQYRALTGDFDMCTFMGKANDGNYRRRLDWKQARIVLGLLN